MGDVAPRLAVSVLADPRHCSFSKNVIRLVRVEIEFFAGNMNEIHSGFIKEDIRRRSDGATDLRGRRRSRGQCTCRPEVPFLLEKRGSLGAF